MLAARLGISERRFWTMLPRELDRLARAHRERVEARMETQQRMEQARFYNMLNALGVVMVGDKWEWQEPKEKTNAEIIEDRWERALAREKAYKAKLKKAREKQDAGQ